MYLLLLNDCTLNRLAHSVWAGPSSPSVLKHYITFIIHPAPSSWWEVMDGDDAFSVTIYILLVFVFLESVSVWYMATQFVSKNNVL